MPLIQQTLGFVIMRAFWVSCNQRRQPTVLLDKAPERLELTVVELKNGIINIFSLNGSVSFPALLLVLFCTCSLSTFQLYSMTSNVEENPKLTLQYHRRPLVTLV